MGLWIDPLGLQQVLGPVPTAGTRAAMAVPTIAPAKNTAAMMVRTIGQGLNMIPLPFELVTT
jgi:hypothetical protein